MYCILHKHELHSSCVLIVFALLKQRSFPVSLISCYWFKFELNEWKTFGVNNLFNVLVKIRKKTAVIISFYHSVMSCNKCLIFISAECVPDKRTPKQSGISVSDDFHRRPLRLFMNKRYVTTVGPIQLSDISANNGLYFPFKMFHNGTRPLVVGQFLGRPPLPLLLR